MGYKKSDLSTFIKNNYDKRILCFGGGSYFQVMYHDLRQRKANITIAGVIDNAQEKKGSQIVINKEAIPVYTPEEAVRAFDFSCTPILITTASHNIVLEQLSHLSDINHMEVYSYFDLKKCSTKALTDVNTSSDTPLIPKIIHYCWLGGKPISSRLQDCIDSWKRCCPDYEIKQWDETNYNLSKNYYLKTSYEMGKYGFVPDYMRLDIIYEHGGIYLDTDVELLKTLDPLTYNQAFFCTEVCGGINEGSGFGAVAGNELVYALKNVYENINQSSPFLYNTCLGKEIKVFHDAGYINNGNYQVLNHNTAIYPFQLMSPKIKETGKICRTEATIGIHHFDGSWCQAK